MTSRLLVLTPGPGVESCIPSDAEPAFVEGVDGGDTFSGEGREKRACFDADAASSLSLLVRETLLGATKVASASRKSELSGSRASVGAASEACEALEEIKLFSLCCFKFADDTKKVSLTWLL